MEAGAGSVAGWQRAAEGHDEGSGTLAAWPSDQHPVTEIKGRLAQCVVRFSGADFGRDDR